MQVLDTRKAMSDWAADAVHEGLTVGCVPTMGFLHEGHLSLIRLARARADRVVVTLFVNPTQFGPNEDLAAYPRDAERDRMLCEQEGVDVLFAPDRDEVYHPDHSVMVTEERLASGLCGTSRPGHFTGVLTVVCKLLNLIRPSFAVFGEKDAQQLRLIERMVRDLDMTVEIVRGPTQREDDGLAMSSRNKNLSDEERGQAVALSKGLFALREAVASGETRVEVLRGVVLEALSAAPFGALDYLALVDDASLEPFNDVVEGKVLAALAVNFSKARLIDNCTVEVP